MLEGGGEKQGSEGGGRKEGEKERSKKEWKQKRDNCAEWKGWARDRGERGMVTKKVGRMIKLGSNGSQSGSYEVLL